ncbi:3-deoxy-7-phosphoheptulonate synthase [Streptoalloteichus hindustanus]|uniref:Phospho-2-dehydro-3-deoxyheptonate aldolase n=1 Tax=Streptoalloteichus hindustanus TaxID=2017 RepID=A0A1M5JRE6_STRHI|nr:3-deoxy-7-phosphoheptulonate synthase [Streptoalloteichus hindustanus]SHG43162.1 3-deoxy-D-arabinoheptulosonate-7-phosphate synthase [Streptoalloteichus hindustanus]
MRAAVPGPVSRESGGRVTAEPLVSPAALAERMPVTDRVADTVLAAREATCRVLAGTDDRLLVVVGPCSVHDVAAAMAYARLLWDMSEELADDLLLVMRVYLEKPRSALGWPGLLTDPSLDGGFAVHSGLSSARELMLAITELGLPIAVEWLSPITPAYLGDLVTWGAIGARTVESQVHRQLASGLPMPVGMKNATSGSVQSAVDAIRAAAAPHAYLGIADNGAPAILRTSGNPHCHVVLRGGSGRPNYSAEDVRETRRRLRAAGLPERVVIDASHGNSGKCHERQRAVAGEIAERIAAGEDGVRGLLLESFIVSGRQDVVPGEPLVFGQSVTDACMGWDATASLLRSLAVAVRERRRHAQPLVSVINPVASEPSQHA